MTQGIRSQYKEFGFYFKYNGKLLWFSNGIVGGGEICTFKGLCVTCCEGIEGKAIIMGILDPLVQAIMGPPAQDPFF